jgi:hypothetical protein
MSGTRRRRLVEMSVVAGMIASGVMPVSATRVEAFCDGGVHWSAGPNHEVWGDTSIPRALRTSVRNAVTGWNGIAGSTWSFSYVEPGPLGPPYNGGWIVFGDWRFTSTVPGMTQTSSTGGVIHWAQTWLNPAYEWNTDGVMNQAQRKADAHTVTMHEMGHWLKLLHPSQCGPMTAAEVAAVMNPVWIKKWVLGSDDRAGAAAKY